MLRRQLRPVLAVLVTATLTALTVGAADSRAALTAPDTGAGVAASTPVRLAVSEAYPEAGPPYQFTTSLTGQYTFIPLKDQVLLQRTKLGYRFRTGQQDSHLVVTLVNGKLRFVDTGTKRWNDIPRACQRLRVRVGVAALCRVPDTISVRRPLLVEIWPRLGDDFTDASTLPATIATTVLGDKGRDVVRFGAGPDFFNGFSERDRVWGGAGNDWLRPGIGSDLVVGGRGNDSLVGLEGADEMYGGSGADRVGGGDGDDRLWAGSGEDFVLCGTGRDRANIEGSDRAFHDCEAVNRN